MTDYYFIYNVTQDRWLLNDRLDDYGNWIKAWSGCVFDRSDSHTILRELNDRLDEDKFYDIIAEALYDSPFNGSDKLICVYVDTDCYDPVFERAIDLNVKRLYIRINELKELYRD